MTLTETLRIEEQFLKFEDLRAFDYCEKRYKEAGEPTGRWELINFLEKIIQELMRNGMGYPKVLLLRKKELQRQQFTVCKLTQNESHECTCFDGWLSPAGKPCPCPKGEPHRTQLRKWGMAI